MVPDRSAARVAAAILATLLVPFAAAIAGESPAGSASEIVQGTSPEVAFWESVRDSNDPTEIEAYLKAYPNGQFAPLARIRLDKLKQATGAGENIQEGQAGDASSATPSDTMTLRVKLGEIPDTRRAMLGVRIAEVPATLAKGLGLADAKGAFVTELVPNSPAQSAGIRVLDIIVALDGQEIEKMWQLPQRVGAMSPGTEVSVALRRPTVSFTELSDRLRGRALKGDVDAAFSLGWLIESGAGTAKNDEEAARWYRKAADQAQAEAAHRLGVMYVDGRGVPKNPAEAVKWYRLATDKNHVRAITSLALMYEIGAGVPKDELEASRLYRQAADQGDQNAMYQLGKMYLDGRGVPNDDAEAIIWLRKAADDGNSNAVTALGVMYEQGRGVFNDDSEAVRLYREAADLNNPWAMYSLARMHTNGRGVSKDETEAFRWYRKAADLGDSDSMYQLGRAYNDGLGTEKNASAAADWIFKALQAHNSFTVKEMTTNADAWDKEFRRELQKRMQQAGAYDGKIDGSFGAGTKRAIEALAKSE